MKNLKTTLLLCICFVGFTSMTNSGSDYVSPDFDEESANYCVKLIETNSSLPIDLAQKVGSIRGAKGFKNGDGIYEFYSPFYSTESEMNKAFDSFLKLGFGTAKKMVEYKGAYYTINQFEAVKTGF